MGAAHSSGTQRGTRRAGNVTLHTLKVSPSSSELTAGKKLITIKASAAKPVLVRLKWYTKTAITGSTPVVNIGTSLLGTNILAAVTLTANVFTPAATSAWVDFWLEADTSYYVNNAGATSIAAGAGYLLVETAEVNVKTITNTSI
jgi:hypothetical protein